MALFELRQQPATMAITSKAASTKHKNPIALDDRFSEASIEFRSQLRIASRY